MKPDINKLKFTTLFTGPVMNRSGYGVASDLIFSALHSYPKLKLGVLPTKWGGCIGRQHPGPYDHEIRKALVKAGNIPQPHVYISNLLPDSAQPPGSLFNINFNAGIETTKAYDQLVKNINLYDLTIVCSNHSKQSYIGSDHKPIKPIEVVPWSADTSIFKIDAPGDKYVDAAMSKIKEDEAFLFVGQNTNFDMIKDRKNLGTLIKVFCQTFKGKPRKPALILKTSGIDFSVQDRNQMVAMIDYYKHQIPDNDCSVYCLHGELTEPQMAALNSHKKVIAHISFTRGEGFGLPLLEFSLCGKPILVSNWSGHLDFLEDKAILLPGTVDVIGQDIVSEFFPPGSAWFNVDEAKASQIMSDFFHGDRTEANAKAKQLAINNANNYSLPMFTKRIHAILDQYLLGKTN